MMNGAGGVAIRPVLVDAGSSPRTGVRGGVATRRGGRWGELAWRKTGTPAGRIGGLEPVRSPLAGWMRFPIALIVAIVSVLVVVPAMASAAESVSPVSPVSPAEGELVDADPVLRWTAAGDAGYELRWNADGALDSSGALEVGDDGGRAFPGGESHRLTDLTAATYHWQVRALPDGAWSPVATFHLDIQLDTLGPGEPAEPPVDEQPVVEAPTDVSVPEAGAGLDLSTAMNGFVWIAAASSFAGLLLAVVGREWLRLRRQES